LLQLNGKVDTISTETNGEIKAQAKKIQKHKGRAAVAAVVALVPIFTPFAVCVAINNVLGAKNG
jgi:hypothetical protein